jgi:hypothetical protein
MPSEIEGSTDARDFAPSVLKQQSGMVTSALTGAIWQLSDAFLHGHLYVSLGPCHAHTSSWNLIAI